MSSVTISISLDLEQHRHILDWYQVQENKSDAVRRVLDAHVREQVRLADVYHEVLSLKELVAALRAHGVVVRGEDDGQVETVETDAIASTLDSLGLD